MDSAFANPVVFVKLRRRAVTKHIRHDFDLSPQAEDEEIYNLAAKNKMFVVTMNYKHFKKFVRKNLPGVFALDSGLSNEQIDTILSNFIASKNPKDYLGRATKVK